MKTNLSLRSLPLFLAFALPWAAAKPPEDLPARLHAWIKGTPGGVAVAWVDADGAVFHQAGKFSAEDARPITPDTQFEIGSVTKVFTALLLAESERAGKVSRSDSAAKYLLPAGDPAQKELAKITLLSLTTHAAGLPRLPANIGANPDASADPYATYDRAALVEALRLHGPVATVGRSAAYSNFGVAVLGEALGAAWGTSYAEALREHVLRPLGMTATSVGLAGAPAPAELAPGHAGNQRVPNWTFLACAPAGALRSATRDMARLLTACLAGETGPLAAAIRATTARQRANEDVGGAIGLGWMLTEDAERPVVWHNGATAGSHAFFAFSPKAGAGVVILANVNKGSEALGFGLLGAKPSAPASRIVKNGTEYVGRYALSPAFAIDITETQGRLFLQATGQGRAGLREVSADRFAVGGVAAEVSFERGAGGKVTALVLHQNGLDQRGVRGELPAATKEIMLPAEALAEYAGEYAASPQFILTVKERVGGLTLQATGQGANPLFASARDEFFLKVVDARISFKRDAAGKVDGLVLHQGGRDLPAKRKQ
jgi:D-alanyl-D-alanine-carboxypeptidase/D-alanyl-D-alanine-endopeptidase